MSELIVVPDLPGGNVASVAAPPARTRRRSSVGGSPVVFLLVTVLVFTLIVGIKAFLFGVFVVPSESMQPLLNPGDRILVNLLDRPGRGDVIIFDGAGSFTAPGGTRVNPLGSGPVQVALGVDPRTFFTKRVIGVPGDTISCCAPTGELVLNGVPLDEPYVYPGNAPSRTPFTVRVPSGHYWVMGDHRDASSDSRAHLNDPTHGLVPASAVYGTLTGIAFSDGTSRDGSGTGTSGR